MCLLVRGEASGPGHQCARSSAYPARQLWPLRVCRAGTHYARIGARLSCRTAGPLTVVGRRSLLESWERTTRTHGLIRTERSVVATPILKVLYLQCRAMKPWPITSRMSLHTASLSPHSCQSHREHPARSLCNAAVRLLCCCCHKGACRNSQFRGAECGRHCGHKSLAFPSCAFSGHWRRRGVRSKA